MLRSDMLITEAWAGEEVGVSVAMGSLDAANTSDDLVVSLGEILV